MSVTRGAPEAVVPDLREVVLAHEPRRRIGPITIEPAFRRLRHADGREEIIDPKVMQVLVALLRENGEVLTRADLNFSCWGRAVGDDALNRVVSRLRRVAEGIGAGVFRIETVTRVGFRLVVHDGGAADRDRPLRRAVATRWPIVAGLAGMLLLVIAAFSLLRPGSPAPVDASIAVRPFHAVTPSDAQLADGLSDELLSQLARHSDLRVAGRSSSWALRDARWDAREIGRKLGVAYVLEGSLRRSGDRVRINASLTSTSSGIQLWGQAFQGSTDDILSLQTRVAVAVAESLNRRLVTPPDSTNADGTAYGLYLAARGLVRTREPGRLAAAIALLEQAVKIDGDFAAALSNLGTAKQLYWYAETRLPRDGGALPEALALQRRALEIEPDLAEAHAALAMILDFQGAESERGIQTAVRLDPKSAENWFWLSIMREIRGDYAGSLRAMRRAIAIDPLWERAYQTAAESAWWLGRPDEGNAYLDRAEAAGRDPHFVRSIRARLHGDWSAAVLEGRLALARGPAENDAQARRRLAFIFWCLGRLDDAAALDGDLHAWLPLTRNALPSRGSFVADYPRLRANWRHTSYAYLLERALLRAGRADYLVAAYDRHSASVDGFIRGAYSHQGIIEEAPVIALALRQAGRTGESAALVAAAIAMADRDMERGPVPGWYHAALARLRAVAGDEAGAVSALKQAVALGWRYTDYAVFGSLADEPAFSRMRSNAQLRALTDRLRSAAHRERAEVARL
jgi:TolB-like protein/DNA-binding winged helix-turn-helix (wHTH) protein